MSQVKQMLSIEGLEFAILGTGRSPGGYEVLVYDGYKVEAVRCIEDYRQELVGAGLLHMAPIFVYLDEGVRDEIGREQRTTTVH